MTQEEKKEIEEKAKAYDKALKVAKDIRNGEATYIPNGTPVIDAIFPELKESEGEVIRKRLLEYFKSFKSGISFNGVPTSDAIAWLEKQGTSYTKKDVDDAYLKGVTDTKNEIEKQYEETYQIRKDIATFIFNYRGNIKDRAKWMNYLGIKVSFVENQGNKETLCNKCKKEQPSHSCQDITALGRCAVEHEQKPTDKVEPTFHEGEWVIQGHNILKIKCVGEKYYCFETVGGYIDDMLVSEIDSQFHLWTIQDAKDGDVLACENGWTCIFNCLNDNLFSSHCFMDNKGWFCEYGGQGHTLDYRICGEIHPATKEQRDTLIKAMTDAGYTFDFEKKELKKIEQKPAWSEEDEYCIHQLIVFCENCVVQDDGAKRCAHWLKSLKDRVQPQQKQ